MIKRGFNVATNQSQKFFIGLTAIVFFIIGVFIGDMLLAGSGRIGIDAIMVGLLLTIILILLILVGLVLENKGFSGSKGKG